MKANQNHDGFVFALLIALLLTTAAAEHTQQRIAVPNYLSNSGKIYGLNVTLDDETAKWVIKWENKKKHTHTFTTIHRISNRNWNHKRKYQCKHSGMTSHTATKESIDPKEEKNTHTTKIYCWNTENSNSTRQQWKGFNQKIMWQPSPKSNIPWLWIMYEHLQVNENAFQYQSLCGHSFACVRILFFRSFILCLSYRIQPHHSPYFYKCSN